MKSPLLTIIALSLFSMVAAQSNYQKATIITNDSQKLNGWVNYKEWARSPNAISFKTSPDNSEVKKYTVKDISYLEVQNMEYYQRFYVSLSTDKREPISDLSYGPDNAVIKDTVFLKIIQKGESVDLFSYRDDIKTRYYLKEHGSDIPIELIFKKYMQPGTNSMVKTAETFKNQLLDAVRKVNGVNTEKLLELLMDTKYNEEDIVRVIEMINGGESQQYSRDQSAKAYFYAGIALSSAKAKYSGTNVLANDAQSKASLFPKLTFGMDFLTNPNIGKYVFRVDLALTGANYNISKTTDDGYKTTHAFKQYTGSLAILAFCNIYNSDPFKLNVGAGISLNLSKYANSNRQIDNLQHPEWSRTEVVDLRSFWIVLPVRIGTAFNKKYEVYGQYNYPISSISDYMNYAVQINSWQVGFNYHF